MCLTLKLLQIQPDKEIIIEYIKQEDYKYLRALGAFYLRLTGSAMDIYNYLEPLYNDYRKLRRRVKSGTGELRPAITRERPGRLADRSARGALRAVRRRGAAQASLT